MIRVQADLSLEKDPLHESKVIKKNGKNSYFDDIYNSKGHLDNYGKSMKSRYFEY